MAAISCVLIVQWGKMFFHQPSNASDQSCGIRPAYSRCTCSGVSGVLMGEEEKQMCMRAIDRPTMAQFRDFGVVVSC